MPRPVKFHKRMVMLGFGSIGQGVLPLLLRHIDMPVQRRLIINPDDTDKAMADGYGVPFLVLPLTKDNFHVVLGAHLSTGDFLLNLSVEVSSVALIAWCRARGVLYLDTCIEPWTGATLDPTVPPTLRTNYALREAALALRGKDRDGPTAVLTLGANPGLVSALLKQALLNIAQDMGLAVTPPASRRAWARLAAQLGVRVIHIAERDSQVAPQRKQPDEFVNTWSVKAFVEEACQPSEMGWGSHERHFPPDAARHATGCKSSIYLNRPGGSTRVRTWTPLAGPIHGFLITHAESISMADYFTLGEGDHVTYRPTVHYAYHPCDDAVLSLHELAGRNWRIQGRQRVLKDDICAGTDELGVLLMGHARNAYWFGSQLTIEEARALCPHNSATSLQVTSAVVAGVVWAINNPQRDVVEPDEIPFEDILRLCRPYLGTLTGVYSNWTPLADRSALFAEDLDREDAWQFKNFRVT